MTQILDVPIATGLDENSDARLRDALSVAEDVVYKRRGGLTPRLGQELLPVEPLIEHTSPGGTDRALVARGDELAVVTGSIVRPYAPSSNQSIGTGQLGDIGFASAYVVERRNEDGSSQTHRNFNQAEGSGFRCYVWTVRDSATGLSSVFYRLVDATTGAALTSSRGIGPAAAAFSAVHVVYKNGLFFIATATPTGLVVTRLDPFFFGTTDVTVNGAASLALAAIPHPTLNYFLVCAQDGINLTVYVISAASTPVVAGAIPFVITAQPTCVGLYCSNPAFCYVVWGEGGVATPPNAVDVFNGIVNVTNPAVPAIVSGPTNIYTESGLDSPAAANSCFVYAASIISTGTAIWAAFTITGRDTTPANIYTTYRPMTALYRLNGAMVPDRRLYAFGTVLASELWANADGTALCMVEQTARYMVPDGIGIVPPLGCMHVVAAVAMGDLSLVASGYPCQVHATFGVLVTPLSDTFRCAASESTQKRQPSNLAKVLVREDGSAEVPCYALERADTCPHVYTAIARPVKTRQHAQMGGRTLITGGMPTLWDGTQSVEWGFVHGPKLVSSSPSALVGGIAAGTYGWAAAYEQIDANGGVIRSPVASLGILTFGAASQVLFSVAPAQLTYKPDSFGYAGSGSRSYIVLYRTEKDSTGPFYRLTAIEVPSGNVNRVGQFAVQINDAYPDTGGAQGPLATFPPLYISGDALEADPVPSCTMVTTWQQRFVLAGTDDDSVWFSTENEDGEVPYFSIGLRLAPFENGRITGIAVLDEKLVLFKETGVFTLSGQLPNKQGIGFIPTPVQVSSDAGCIDPSSIVVFPQGVMFRSARGLYLLDRSLAVSFVGEPIARSVEASERTVAPVLVTKQNHIRFDLQTEDENGTGILAVFDYLRGVWTQWRYDRDGDEKTPAAQIVGADGRVYWLDGDGALWRERADSYTDSGTAPLVYRARSGWLKPAGAQGYFTAHRAGVLGKYGIAHKLTVNVYADFDESTVIATNTWDLTSAPTSGYQFVASIATARTARMQALAVEVLVEPVTGSVVVSPEPPAELSSFIVEWDPIDSAPQRRVGVAQKR